MLKKWRILSFFTVGVVASIFGTFLTDIFWYSLGSFIADFWVIFLVAFIVWGIGSLLIATFYDRLGNRPLQDKLDDEVHADIQRAERRLHAEQAE